MHGNLLVLNPNHLLVNVLFHELQVITPMKKIKNEAQLVKLAISFGEKYALKRGYKHFSGTDSSKQKIEALYRLLVNDKLIVPVPPDKEDQIIMKHKLAIWISKQLPPDHELLKD